MRLTTHGKAIGLVSPVVGRIAFLDGDEPEGDSIVVVRDERDLRHATGYRAAITRLKEREVVPQSDIPTVAGATSIDHLTAGDIVVLMPNGFVRTLYRPGSRFNSLFVTERCNSNCLMCSQPPKDIKDDWRLSEAMEVVRLIDPSPEQLGITGGEPTLLGGHLIELISELRTRHPDTNVHMLSNGRAFAERAFARRFAESAGGGVTVGVPIYGADPDTHDYVQQAPGSFAQTVMGIQQLARHGVPVEIRVVVHAVTVPVLEEIAYFVYRNFPFAVNVALMGLEMMGYTKRNLSLLWIDPVDYQDELRTAVEFLAIRGMHVSIYNHQLCVLDRGLWAYSRKAISDWKNVYLEACDQCAALDLCGGLFVSSARQHSQGLRRLSAAEVHG